MGLSGVVRGQAPMRRERCRARGGRCHCRRSERRRRRRRRCRRMNLPLGSRAIAPTWDDNVAGMAEAFSFKATADGPVDIVNVYLERHWDRRKMGNPGARLIARHLRRQQQPSRARFWVRRRARGSCRDGTPGTPFPPLECIAHQGQAATGSRSRVTGSPWGLVSARAGRAGARTTSPKTHRTLGGGQLPTTWRTGHRPYRNDAPLSAYAVEKYSVLVFTKNASGNVAGGRGRTARARRCPREVTFDVTDDAGRFTAANLAKYRAVVFLNNTGDAPRRRPADERSRTTSPHGGGFIGIHSAIEAEPDWQFMSDLLGTRAGGHGRIRSRGDDQGHRPRAPRQQGPAGVLDADRTAGTSSPATSAASRTSSRRSTRTPTPAARTAVRSPDRLVQGLPGRPLLLHRWRRHGGHVLPRQGFRKHLAGALDWAAGKADKVYSDCGATVLDELPADEGVGTAQHQRADRHRPAAGRAAAPDGARRSLAAA